jgi:hypothetical protein
MAAFRAPPAVRSVRKTVLCSEPPNHCRSGNFLSTTLPAHFFPSSAGMLIVCDMAKRYSIPEERFPARRVRWKKTIVSARRKLPKSGCRKDNSPSVFPECTRSKAFHSFRIRCKLCGTRCVRLKRSGRVAQLVEQCPFKAWVAGSSPAALTRCFQALPFLAQVPNLHQ